MLNLGRDYMMDDSAIWNCPSHYRRLLHLIPTCSHHSVNVSMTYRKMERTGLMLVSEEAGLYGNLDAVDV